MSDARTRALEAAAQRGEPGAREALDRARYRRSADAIDDEKVSVERRLVNSASAVQPADPSLRSYVQVEQVRQRLACGRCDRRFVGEWHDRGSTPPAWPPCPGCGATELER